MNANIRPDVTTPIDRDRADADERWADEQIAALMAEYVAVMGSTWAGKLRLVASLAGEALFQLYDANGDITEEEYDRYKLRLEAIEHEAHRRRTGEPD